jgi:hypothetical protein
MAYQIQIHDLKQRAANNYIGDLKVIDLELSTLIRYEESDPMDIDGTGEIICLPDGTSSNYDQSKIRVNFPDPVPDKEIYPANWGFFYSGSSEIGRFNATVSRDLFDFYRVLYVMNKIDKEFNDNHDNVFVALKVSDLTIPVQREGKRYTLLVCGAKALQPRISGLEAELHEEADQW